MVVAPAGITDIPAWVESEFFTPRGISMDIARDAGVRWLDGALAFPRVSREGELVGWKLRDPRSRKMWNEPKGIRGCAPFQVYSQGYGSTVYLCEGETDGLALASVLAGGSLGPAESVLVLAQPGADGFQPWWAEQLKGRDVVVLPDGDAAGRKMKLKVARWVPYARFATLPQRTDVGDLVEHGSLGVLGNAISNAATIAVDEIPSRALRQERPNPLDARLLADRLVSEASRLTTLSRRAGELAALCPLHEERTPSFMVNPGKGVWYCHGCQQGGTVIDLVMLTQNISYGQALDYLQR